MTGMILIDLQKVLEIMDHDVILQDLFAFGFSKQAVNLFKFYLSKPPFLINLGNKFPQPSSVSRLYFGITFVFNICQWHVPSCHIECFSLYRWFLSFLTIKILIDKSEKQLNEDCRLLLCHLHVSKSNHTQQ